MKKQEKRKPIAVIELGSTSIRMMVGEVLASGEVHQLDELEHAVALGSYTEDTGNIGTDTTERCVTAMRSFRNVLAEYSIDDRNVRVVATSAVREADNRDRFIDRILVATGLDVEVIDEAEVSRLTYRAIQPKLRRLKFFKKHDVMVVEVGGGSTETLLFRKGKVSTSHLYRLGSLRLRALVSSEDVPTKQSLHLMCSDMDPMLSQVRLNLQSANSPEMVLLGSEARFACAALAAKHNGDGIWELSVPALRKLMRKILSESIDELVRTYHVTYSQAETLGTSLLIAVTLAEQFMLKTVHVSDVTLRTGIMIEEATGETWTAGYRRQVINSAEVLARRHGVDIRHSNHVAAAGLQIIKTLRCCYSITAREEVIFHVASLLHEVGLAINTASHHKHSHYIIMHSDIFGLGKKDIAQVALIARYHRGAIPKPSHTDYMSLDHASRIAVAKLAAVLRLANALDRLHSQHRLRLDMHINGTQFIIEFPKSTDLALLRRRAQERSILFEDIFGMSVVLRHSERQHNDERK